MINCLKCGKKVDGFRCDMCGEAAAAADPAHRCGADHMVPKCSVCEEAQTRCVCHAKKKKKEEV